MKRLNSFPILILALSVTCFSCGNEGGGNAISNLFRKEIIDTSAVNKFLTADSFDEIYQIEQVDSNIRAEDISELVQENCGIWFSKYGLTQNAKDFLDNIKHANLEGLKSSDYLYNELDSLSEKIEDLSAEELASTVRKFSYSYFRFSNHILFGIAKPLDINPNWQNKNDTISLHDSLISWTVTMGIDSVLDELRPKHLWYKKFKQTAGKLNQLRAFSLDTNDFASPIVLGDSSDHINSLRRVLKKVSDSTLNSNSLLWDVKAMNALKKYQRDFGLSQTGELDSATVSSLTQATDKNIQQLGLNMERIRWLKKDFNGEFIWVNIPQMEVKYFEDDSVTFNMNAVVGRLSRKTPTLDARLSDIVFNPPWFVPPTILRQEVVPGIARRGGSYLARRGLVARDRRGRRVNPSKINASNYRRYSISQNPGRNSALGSVKFNFPNKEAIFLHDTNHRGDFTKKYRARSSGCIRVHHPKDFARFILRDSTYNSDGIDSIIKKRSTKSVEIERRIDVHIVYLTNAVDSLGNVIKVNDIYKWDRKLADKLKGDLL